MELNLKVSSDDIPEIEEKDIQRSFEKNLNKIEEGLIFIDNQVTIGTGIIDTLAIDEEGNPVIIEYKKSSKFGYDGLVQLMDYLSWFKKTEANFLVLKGYIEKKKNKIEDIKPDIRLILIIQDIEDDRILNACYSITNHIQIWGFKLLKETGSITIVPFKIMDNQEITPISTKINLNEDQILNNFTNWKQLYKFVREYVMTLSDNIESYPLYENEIAFRGNRVFLRIRFRKKKGLMLDMGEVKGIEDPRFKYWKDIDWGYIHINSEKELDDDVKEWIKKAYLSG